MCRVVLSVTPPTSGLFRCQPRDCGVHGRVQVTRVGQKGILQTGEKVQGTVQKILSCVAFHSGMQRSAASLTAMQKAPSERQMSQKRPTFNSSFSYRRFLACLPICLPACLSACLFPNSTLFPAPNPRHYLQFS